MRVIPRQNQKNHSQYISSASTETVPTIKGLIRSTVVTFVFGKVKVNDIDTINENFLTVVLVVPSSLVVSMRKIGKRNHRNKKTNRKRWKKDTNYIM
jgi:hypothetical protein